MLAYKTTRPGYMFVVLTLCSETVCVTFDGSDIDTVRVALERLPFRPEAYEDHLF